MEERLTDRLERSGLSDRTQKIILLNPGILFGFSDSDLDQMIERVDCPFCQKILEITSDIVDRLALLEKNINDLCGPVRDRNRKLEERYQSWQRVPIFRWFVTKPRFELEPEYKNLPWYIEVMQAVDELETDLQRIESDDSPHWKDDKDLIVSKKVVARLISRDHWYVSKL